ncbi:unnamed protein product, partial [Prorocentrum cordatum]
IDQPGGAQRPSDIKPATEGKPLGPVFYLHVPKSGGASWERDARRAVKSKASSFTPVETCICYANREDFRVVLLLRSPPEHVVSQYTHWSTYHGKGNSSSRLAEMSLMPQQLEQWVRVWADIKYHTLSSDNVSQAADLPCAAGLRACLDRYVYKTGCKYVPIDFQTERLTCDELRRIDFPFPKRSVTLAIQNVEEAWFVGIVEAYQESLCLLYEQVSGALPDTCHCTDVDKWRGMKLTHVQHGITSRSVSELPAQTIQLIDELTEGDRSVYRAGVARFLREVRRVEARHNTTVLCNSTLQKLLARAK